MNFFSLALRNVRGNFRNYFTYLLSTTVAVMIFYVFYTIAYNKQFVELSKDIGKLSLAFTSSAMIVALFAVMFIWYSNNFFVRTRKKEIATYSLLGMTKRQIARMIFYENLSLGLLSLAVGIGLGILFAKLFAMLLIFMMGAQAQVEFAIVPQAIKTTTSVFLILFLLNSLQGYTIIYRFKLVQLLQAEKEGEKIPKASLPAALLALLLIGAGYYMAWFRGFAIASLAIPILVLVIAGTYILFNSAVVFLIRLLRQRKGAYYRGVNLVSTSQLFFRIKGNARMLATIAILSAVTLTAVGTSFTLFAGNAAIMRLNFPYSMLYPDTLLLDKQIPAFLKLHPEAGVQSVDHLQLLPASVEAAPPGKKKYAVNAYIISQSQYRNVVSHQGLDRLQTIPDERSCLVTGATQRIITQGSIPGMESSNHRLSINAGDQTWNYVMVGKPVRDFLNMPFSRPFCIVVTDASFAQMVSRSKVEPVKLTGYMLSHPEATQGLYSALKGFDIPNDQFPSSYYEAMLVSRGLFGVLAYIGMFLGLLFFLATGSIIYFKQLIEANDDSRRFAVLRHIGLSQAEIRQAVSKQLAVVFGMPLVIGITHSFFALAVLKQLLFMNIFPYTSVVTGVYILLYLGYYVLTVNSYTKVIMKSKKVN